MNVIRAQSFIPITITIILSILFKGGYDPLYALNLLIGLTFFFYFAECVRRAARALTTRRVHHYAIPFSVVRLYTPSISAIMIIWMTHTSLTLTHLLINSVFLATNALMLWGFIWGFSRLVSRKCANRKLFIPTTHYGLQILMLCTPIFYPLSAIRIEWVHTILGYNPLAIAIITARAISLNQSPAIPFMAIGYALTAALAASFIGYAYSRLIKASY